MFSLRTPLVALAFFALMLPACSSDDGAGGGSNIPTGRGFGEPCDLDVNCRSGLSCTDATCQPRGDAAEGAPCTISLECSDGLYCSTDNVCAAGGEADLGDPCQTTADCMAGTVCRPQGFALACVAAEGMTDVGGMCGQTSDCLGGLGCFQGLCTAGMDNGLPPIWIPEPCEGLSDGPLRVLFEVPRDDTGEFYALPFPNDIRLKNGSIDMTGHRAPPLEGYAGPIVDQYLTRISEDLNGFGLNPVIYFRFSDGVELGTLRDAEEAPRFKLYDVTEGETYGEQKNVAWAAVSGPGSGGNYICDNWVAARVPWGRSLKPGHTYAMLIYKGVSGGGVEVGADSDFEAMMSGTRPSDAALGEAWDAYQPMRDFMNDQDIASVDVIGGTVFTTQSHEDLIPALKAAVATADAPAIDNVTLCDGVSATTSPCDDGLTDEDHVRGCFDVSTEYHEIHGTMQMPMFQQGTAPFETVEDGGGLEMSGGAPVIQGTQPVCVSMTVPKTPTMPEEGWPLVIYAHGTGGSFRSHAASDVASMLSNLDHNGTMAGAVVLGFDQVVHGTRAGESTWSPESLYFNFTNPQGARGHLYQGSADLLYLARLAENGWELDASASPTGEAIRIDPTRIYLLAHSQGTQYAGIIAAYERQYSAYVMSGAGGGLLLSLLAKTEPVNIAAGVKFALNDLEVDEYHPALNLVQTYFDPVDPINYSEDVLFNIPEMETRPHWFHIYGVGDSYTPDLTQQRLAVGIGAPLVTPAPDPFGGVNEAMVPVTANFAGTTALVRQYEPDDTYDGHFVVFRNANTQGDVAEFFGSLIVDGIPEVR